MDKILFTASIVVIATVVVVVVVVAGAVVAAVTNTSAFNDAFKKKFSPRHFEMVIKHHTFLFVSLCIGPFP